MVRTFASGTEGREYKHVCLLPGVRLPLTNLKESACEDRGLPQWNSPIPARLSPLLPGQVEQGEEAESRKVSRDEKRSRECEEWLTEGSNQEEGSRGSDRDLREFSIPFP